MVINELLEWGYKKCKLKHKFSIIRCWMKQYPKHTIEMDFTCISPISNKLKKRFIANDELAGILMWCNHYIWNKIDLDLNCTGYVKRRIVNSKLEKEMLKGNLSKDEFLLITTNLKNNIDAIRNELLNEELPF